MEDGRNNRCAGISLKTQLLYVVVFVTRYIDLLFVLWGEWISLYNFTMKLFFIGSTGYIIYLMRYRFRYATGARMNARNS